MSAENAGIQRSLSLRDLISHFACRGQLPKSSNKNGHGLNPSASSAADIALEKKACLEYVKLAAAIASRLVNRLVRTSEDNEDHQQGEILETSSAGLQHKFIQPEDILAENFLVEISCEECEQSVLGNVTKVEFVSSLQDIRGVKYDERVPDAYLQSLGHLFYELFSPGSKSLQLKFNDTKSRASDELTSDSGHNTAAHNQIQWEGEEEPGSEKRRRTRKILRNAGPSDVEDSLQQKNVPISVCRLVADLIHADDTFESLNDVMSELNDIIGDPDICLGNEDTGHAGLHFIEDILYGRNAELTEMIRVAASVHMDALGQVEDRSQFNNIILIGGEPGSGKSHLVRRVENTLGESGWSCIRCKFDRLAQNQPLSTISSAFENFFHNIAALQSEVADGVHYNEDDEEEEEFRNELLSSVRSHLSASGIVVLSELIPSFRILYPDVFRMLVIDDDDVCFESDDDNDECKNSNTQNLDDLTINDDVGDDDDDDACINGSTFRKRLHYLVQSLICAMATHDRPVLFFLDDLQWADITSLELLSSLVLDVSHMQQIGNVDENDSHPFLAVGTYRSNEVHTTHILVDLFDAFEKSNTVRVKNISLDGISKTDTNNMVSGALKLPVRLTRALTDVVYTKTMGNPFFVKSFLTSLVEENMIKYSLVDRRWVWDIGPIQSVSLDDNVAIIMMRKLLRMPPDVQASLAIASCFGVQVEEEILQLLSDSDQFRMMIPCIEVAIQEGIMEKRGVFYIFCHDIIQQVVYDYIPLEKADDLHYNIGSQLIIGKSIADVSQLNRIEFIALTQINKIKDLGVTDPSFHRAFATLNLKAGEQSIEVADFSSALSYIERGMLFLGNNGWDLNYKLCLRLHETACLACYLNALPNMVDAFFDKIVKNTHSFEERIKSYYILIRTMASKGELKESVEKAFYILTELGEDFPSDVTTSMNVSMLMSTKELLGNYSQEILLNAPKMIDERKRWAMKFLDLIIPYIFMVFPKKMPLVSCRMVKLSIEHGICLESAFGFLAYGHSFLSILHDIDEGYRLAKLSISMLEMFNAKAVYPKLKCLNNSFVAFWVEPIQSSASALAQCRQDALMVGDIEHAAVSASNYCIQRIQCGCQLDVLEKEFTRFSIEMVKLGQMQHVTSHAFNHNTVVELTGKNINPFEVAELPIDNEDGLLRHAIASGRSSLAQNIYFNRMFVAFFFKRYNEAAEMAEKYRALKSASRIQDMYHIFYQGLTAFHFSRSKVYEPEWISLGEESVVTFQSWAKHSIWNFENKLSLLQAECLFSKGNNEAAEEKYKSSIESARKHRFLHEEGLALELAGVFYNSCGKVKEEAEMTESARGCYKKWGAHGLLKSI